MVSKNKVLDKVKMESIQKRKEEGAKRLKYEKEANKDLPAAKKSIRRKGFGMGKAFHLALEQTRRFRE